MRDPPATRIADCHAGLKGRFMTTVVLSISTR